MIDREENRQKRLINTTINFIRKRRPLLMFMSAAVVFVTAYMLILPALTLDTREAAQQGGIDLPAVQEQQEPGSQGELSCDTDGCSVSAAFDAKAGLPQDTELAVEPIDAHAADYEALREDALQAVQAADGGDAVPDLKFAYFYDISLLAEGEPVEPESPVDVTISYDKPLKVSDADHLRIVHFGEDGPQMLDPAQVTFDLKKGKLKGTAFAADSFSVYALVYTVDFHWDVDGKDFTYSIAGGSAVSLKDLLPLIGVVHDDPDTEVDELKQFTDEITGVRFSDESLVKVVHTEKNTTLKKLKEEMGISPDAKGSVIGEAETGSDTAGKPVSKTRYSIPLEENTDGLVFGPPKSALRDAGGRSADTEASELAVLSDEDRIPAGSWILISLKPFDTEETLSITMQDDREIVIAVTDKSGNNWDVWFDGTLGQSQARNGYYSGAENRHQSVSDSSPANKITLPSDANFRHPTGYEYTLKGWYLINPANGEKQYYNAGESDVTISHDCVFYADWVPKSYDKGPASGRLLVGDTPSTAGFVKTEMFDYNELINAVTMGSAYDVSINNGGHSEKWKSNGDFTFVSWNYYNNPQYFDIGYPDDWNNRNLGDKNRYRGDDITTGILSENLKNKLFDPSDSTGKTYVGTGDYLFRYNEETGEYYYDSDINAATYNQHDRRFYVYQDKELIANNNGDGMTNFLPYNDYPGGGIHAQNTGATNYWFGMKNTISFYLPDDVGTGGNKTQKDNSQNMQFKFSGDDDVWVFVDDKLVLDLGGIHNRVGGVIDFSTGTVTKFKGTLTEYQNPTVDEEASELLKSVQDGEHTLTVYYLERGSSLSNCSIYFNLQPQPKSLDLSKRVVGLTESELGKYQEQEFHYELVVNGQLYNSPAKAENEDEAIARKYKAVWYDKNGNEVKRDIIKDGQITITHGQTVRIPYLNRFDTFYVAEQQRTNMEMFETPHAERVYHEDGTTIVHEEEVYLKPSHSQLEGNRNMVDWETYQYKLNDTEKVTFTNTLREKDLEVEKTWKDVPEKDRKPVTFTVKATIPGEGTGAAPVEVEIEAVKDKRFILDPDKNWKTTIEKLPATTQFGKPITYTVVEEDNGFVSSVKTAEKGVCDVDVVKYWPDEKHTYWANNPDHAPEIIRFKLKNGAGKFYNGVDKDGKPVFDSEGQWYELNERNGYVQRFRDLPASDDYTYYEPDSVDENKNTTGLSVFKRSLIGTVIENSPMPKGKLKVQKVWKDADGKVMDNPPEGTEMKYEIYRVSHVHEWSEWKKIKDPTELANGEEERHCLHEGCSAAETRSLEKIGHNWVHDESRDQPVTCTKDGYEYWYCSNPECPDRASEQRNIITKLGHDWDEGKITLEPVWNEGAGTWNQGEITYTCKRCKETRTEHYTPKNLFPGTDIPLQEDAFPKGEHDSSEKVRLEPSGIFEYNGRYCIIWASTEQNWNQLDPAQVDPIQKIKDFNVGIEIPDKPIIYNKQTFRTEPGHNGKKGYDEPNQQREDLEKGKVLYKADDGTWYIFKDNANQGKNPEADSSRWYKIPGTGPSSSGDGFSIENGGNASKPAPARRRAKANAVGNTNTELATTAEINAKLKTLRERIGYKDASGEAHLYYVVEKLDPDGFSLPYQEKWQRTHDVDLEDENGNPYTYYVVETSPTTGWVTTYKGEPADGYSGEALKGNDCEVVITNQLDRPKSAVMKIVKVDQERKPLENAKFALYGGAYDPGKTAAENEGCRIANDLVSRKDNAAPAEAVIYSGELQAGTYYLVETDPPNGYMALAGPVKVEVTADGGDVSVTISINGEKLEYPDVTKDGSNWTVQIMNNSGYELPSAGGPGTVWLYALGMTLLLGCGITLIVRRRMASFGSLSN